METKEQPTLTFRITHEANSVRSAVGKITVTGEPERPHPVDRECAEECAREMGARFVEVGRA